MPPVVAIHRGLCFSASRVYAVLTMPNPNRPNQPNAPTPPARTAEGTAPHGSATDDSSPPDAKTVLAGAPGSAHGSPTPLASATRPASQAPTREHRTEDAPRPKVVYQAMRGAHREFAQQAFEDYSANADGKTHDGKQIPNFNGLTDSVRDNWAAAVRGPVERIEMLDAEIEGLRTQVATLQREAKISKKPWQDREKPEPERRG